MKNILLIYFIFLCPVGLFAQITNETNPQSLNRIVHSAEDVSVSLSGDMLFNNPFKSVFAGGLKIKMFVGEGFSFDTDLVVGKDYFHFGPGIFGLPILIFGTESGFSTDEQGSFGVFLFSLAMIALSAEHAAYHFRVNNNTEFSPFISLLRLKHLNTNKNETLAKDDGLHAFFVAGFELNRYYKRFIISPYLEYNVAYSGYSRGFNLGINVGYYFPQRNRK